MLLLFAYFLSFFSLSRSPATSPYPIIPSDQYEPFLVVPTALKRAVLFDDQLTGYGLNKVLFTVALAQKKVSFFTLSQSYAVHLSHNISPAKTEWLADPLIRTRHHHYLQTFKQCPASQIPHRWSALQSRDQED